MYPKNIPERRYQGLSYGRLKKASRIIRQAQYLKRDSEISQQLNHLHES
jgi:hypothetical protein